MVSPVFCVSAMRDVSDWPEEDRQPMVQLYGEEEFRRMWADWVDVTLRFKGVE